MTIIVRLLALALAVSFSAWAHAQQSRVVPIETAVLGVAGAPGGDLDEACATDGVNAIQ